MSHEIRVPRLGWSMEEGTFVRWLKGPGEGVRVDDPRGRCLTTDRPSTTSLR